VLCVKEEKRWSVFVKIAANRSKRISVIVSTAATILIKPIKPKKKNNPEEEKELGSSSPSLGRSEGKKNSLAMILGIGAVLVILIGVGLYFFSARKKTIHLLPQLPLPRWKKPASQQLANLPLER